MLLKDGGSKNQLSAASKVINSQIINRIREVFNKSASDAVAAINSQISDID